ncbi:MAG: hypothetical protein H6857_02540 [Rhodospirillales bacterium]|nr:hypothetical protein [Rhodospirillales bacterium]
MGTSGTDSSHSDFNGASQVPVSQADLREKLKSYYLVRSYAADADPYAVISDLPEEEGQRVAVKNDPIRGADNYQQRIKTEIWLRQNAEASGVDLAKHTPAYFAFTNDPSFIAKITAQESPHKNLIVLPADQVDLSNWSFTMDDHFFANFDNGNTTPSHAEPHPLHGRVLNALQLVHALETYGYPKNPYKNNFEAQMWANRPSFLQPQTGQMTKIASSHVGGRTSIGSGPG